MTKKINKIMLVLALALAFALALVIVSSATTFVVSSSIENSSDSLYGGYYMVNYGNVSNGNFSYLTTNGNDNYTLVIFNIEAFKTRYNGYTAYEFETELNYQLNNSDYSVNGLYNSFFVDNFYYGFPQYGALFDYVMSWAPPVSQEQLQSAITQAEQEVWQEVDNINVNQYIYGFSSNGALLNNVDITNGATLTEFIATNYIAQRNIDLSQIDTLQGEYNTLQGEYNTLNNSIPSIKAEAKNEGYNEGMRDGDAVERGVMSIVGAPMYILTSIFDVEIFGINLLNLITTIMTIIIVAWVIKKLAN